MANFPDNAPETEPLAGREQAKANAQAAMQIQTSFFEAKNTRFTGGSLSPQPAKLSREFPIAPAFTPKLAGSKHADFVQKAAKIAQVN